jgi:hypothetical protein
MALRTLVKKTVTTPSASSSTAVVDLYRFRFVCHRSDFSGDLSRSMIRELPRVMSIYDVDLPRKEALTGVQYHFRKNSHLKDARYEQPTS